MMTMISASSLQTERNNFCCFCPLPVVLPQQPQQRNTLLISIQAFS